MTVVVFRPSELAVLLLLAAACGHSEPRSESTPVTITLPNSPKDPWNPSGSKASPAAYLGERNRCIDRELAVRDLNEFGDPPGTKYPTGRPLGLTASAGRYDYVLRNHPEIRTSCSAAPGEPVR